MVKNLDRLRNTQSSRARCPDDDAKMTMPPGGVAEGIGLWPVPAGIDGRWDINVA